MVLVLNAWTLAAIMFSAATADKSDEIISATRFFTPLWSVSTSAHLPKNPTIIKGGGAKPGDLHQFITNAIKYGKRSKRSETIVRQGILKDFHSSSLALSISCTEKICELLATSDGVAPEAYDLFSKKLEGSVSNVAYANKADVMITQNYLKKYRRAYCLSYLETNGTFL